ncbi:hypothetical protein GGR53DRAFT_477597 [Hypoxylon sp. FL1150]|nr:hypothetical protein GGR53DRAFT_477597 [Hypoxylon sp. FL1150]
MQQPTPLALLAAFLLCQTHLASAYDATPHIWPLDPWKINRLTITAPAPGHAGTIDIAVAIENPNTVSAGPAPHAAGGGYLPFAPSAANCSATTDGAGECVETSQFSYGTFAVAVAVAAAPSPMGFDLSFHLDYNVTRWNNVMYKVYDAAARFEVGSNLVAVGKCDDDRTGMCEYELMPESTPFEIPGIVMSDCKGYCQMPSTNGTSRK